MNPIPPEKLDELTDLYERYEYPEDFRDPDARKAKVIFDSECQRLYQAEAPNIREKMTSDKYQAAVVIPDILNHMKSGRKYPST
jgi:hypothetical protein